MLTGALALLLAVARKGSQSGDDIHWAAIATSIATLAGAGGLVWAARQAQLAKKTWVALGTREIWTGWNDAGAGRRAADAVGSAAELREHMATLDRTSEEFGALLREPNYFEQVGVMAELGGLDFRFVDEHLGPAVVERWNVWYLAIGWIREEQARRGAIRTNNNVAYRAFHDLAERMAVTHNLAILSIPGH